MRHSRVIPVETPDGLMPVHMKGCEGNLLVGTLIQSLRIPGPLDGAPGAPTTGHPSCHFIPRSGCSGQLCPDSVGFGFEP
jgi:hypothetical protein